MPTEKTRVLITVMTYPHPSGGYKELVCTAGITEQGEWVRLYPIDYRYMPRNQQFHKYQWIEVLLEERGHGNDDRKESRRPDLDSIRLLGEQIPPSNKWRKRRELIDPLPHHTLNELKALFADDKTSLGIVRPTEVIDMVIRKTKSEWKSDWQQLFNQPTLFGEQQKRLTKIPYSFHYIFKCKDSEKPHTAMCEDWELGVLFLKEVENLGSEKQAAQSVRDKFLNQLCATGRDTRFFMGTFFPYNTWLVLGVFWPPKIQQRSLF